MMENYKINLEVKRYYIQILTKGLVAQWGVNDVPLVKTVDSEAVSCVLPINDWLINGKNNLTGVYDRAPDNKEDDIVVRIKVFIADNSKPSPVPSEVIREFLWPPENPKMPHRISLNFEIEGIPETLFYTRSEQLGRLSEDDKDDILAEIEKLRRGLENRDYDSVYQQYSIKYNDQAISEGQPAGSNRDNIIGQLQMLDDYSGMSSLPLEKENAVFGIVAMNKAVLVSRKDGRAGISFENEDMNMKMEIYLAKINSEWKVVR
jgi:hypothetical protein